MRVCHSVGRSRGRQGYAPLSVHLFQFHAVFGETAKIIGWDSPLYGVGAPPPRWKFLDPPFVCPCMTTGVLRRRLISGNWLINNIGNGYCLEHIFHSSKVRSIWCLLFGRHPGFNDTFYTGSRSMQIVLLLRCISLCSKCFRKISAVDESQCTQPHSGKFVCLTSIWMVPFEIALGQCDFLTCSQYNNKNNKLKHL